ncbi:hypothetical protein H0B56_00720 [Haloechinothrix sp. YIM 98757]|uniref:Mercuric ion transport protein n=1 Tax=Haloechinothrix aidingensis TaxID=2752311 RepID=A0A838A706_9PSEU|nr:hypothetical protein [Haloechinothrix aidingensis]MBA0124061.1 hypothetical protein [Haloechinothrix aidingensis]
MPDPETPTSSADTGHRQPGSSGSSGGWWAGAIALLAVACCAVPVLLSGGVLAGIAGIGMGGVAGTVALVAAVAILSAAVVMFARGRRACSRGDGQADRTDDHRA